MSCAKTDEPIEMPFMVWILGETKEPYIRWRHERGNFVGHLPADTVSRRAVNISTYSAGGSSDAASRCQYCSNLLLLLLLLLL